MQDHRLPTRVSKACDRCRRQKQRVSATAVQGPDRELLLLEQRLTIFDSVTTFAHAPTVSRPSATAASLKDCSRLRGKSTHKHDRAELRDVVIRDGNQRKRARSAASPSLSPRTDQARLTRAHTDLQQPGQQDNGPPPTNQPRPRSSPRVGNVNTADATWREHSIVAEFGDSNSAMDITRRVGCDRIPVSILC